MNLDNVFQNCIMLGLKSYSNLEFTKAEVYWKFAIKIKPKAHFPYAALGAYYIKFRKFKTGIECFKKAIELGRKDYKILYELGMAYFWSFDFKKAEQTLLQSIPFKEKKESALESFIEKGSPEVCLEKLIRCISHIKSLGIDPMSMSDYDLDITLIKGSLYPYAKTLSILGISAYRQGLLDLAKHLSLFSLKFMPLLDTYNTLALSYVGTFHFRDAKINIEHAMALSQEPITLLNGSFVYLISKSFQRGWDLHESRKDRKDHKVYFGKLDKTKEWKGEDITGETLLVASEQGYGDCIQYSRFFNTCLKKLNCRIILSCKNLLIEVMQLNFPFLEVLGIDAISDQMVDHDVYILQGSLPKLLNITDKSIPLKYSYLNAPTKSLKKISPLISKTKNFKVGFTWEVGSTQPENYNFRRIPFEYFIQLMGIKGIDFYSIQPGFIEKPLRKYSSLNNLKRLGGYIGSFSDTFAAVKQMDLIISPDTSTHHVAGSLGVANWLILPILRCWRWFDNTETNPWYPSGKLFSQKIPGCWDEPFKEIYKRLQKISNLHSQGKFKKRDEAIYFKRNKALIKK